MKKFLGRTLNTNTMMWEYPDGSGYPCPEEMRQAVFLSTEMRHETPNGYANGIEVLGTLFRWQERMRKLSTPPTKEELLELEHGK